MTDSSEREFAAAVASTPTGQLAAQRTGAPELRWSVLAAVAALALQALATPAWMEPRYFLKYPAAARAFADGAMAPERIVDFSPLYLALHRALVALGLDPVAIVFGLQAVALGVAAGCLHRLLCRWVGPAWAFAGVAVFAVDRHVLIYRAILEPESLLLAAVLATMVAATEGRAAIERGSAPLARRLALAAGVAAALAVALRPSALPFVLVTGALLATGLRPPSAWGERGALLGQIARFALPVAAVVALLAVQSARATGSAGSPRMNPGTVFFEGNNPLSDGTSAVYPPSVMALARHEGYVSDAAHEHYRTIARAVAGRALSISEVNAFWRDRALAFLAENPAIAARLLSAKLTKAFHGFRWHDISVARGFEQSLTTPYLPVSLLAALALAGMLVAAARWRELALVYALVAAQLVVMVVFYVSARQRLLLVPAWIVFAALAVRALAHSPWHRRIVAAVAILVLAAAFALPDDRVADFRRRAIGGSESERLLAPVRAAVAAGEPIAAHVDTLVAAAATAPWTDLRPAFVPRRPISLEARIADQLEARGSESVESSFDLAVASLAAGRVARAEELFEPLERELYAAYRGATMPSLPAVFRARIAAAAGERARSVERAEAALALAPGDPFALAELAAWGEVASDETEAGERLAHYFSPIDRDLLVGEALLARGAGDEAAEAFGRALERLPELREARVRRAAALAVAGRDDEAAAEYLRASGRILEPILEAERLGALFERWGGSAARSPAERLFAAQALEQLGWFDEARLLLEGWEPDGELGLRAAETRARLARIAAALAGRSGGGRSGSAANAFAGSPAANREPTP